MILNIRPILSALSRNRTGAILVALEIAIALAVMVNATWIVAQRIQQIEAPSGLDDRDIFAMAFVGISSHSNLAAAQREDIAYLRSLPGVATSSLPSKPRPAMMRCCFHKSREPTGITSAWCGPAPA